MSRPPRIQFPGALYHVTSRGNRRQILYTDRRDYLIWLDLLAEVVEKHAVRVHGYCLMPNHFHLIIETPLANLSASMHSLNARYCQHFNKRHGACGHVLQGRFHAILVEFNKQLLAVSRYVSLNPVRARLVQTASDWPWSNHRHFLAPEFAPPWLQTEWMLSQFGEPNSHERIVRYERFVMAGIGKPNPLQFDDRMQNANREQALALHEYAERYPNRTEAIAQALRSGAYSRQQICEYFGVSSRTVSRALTAFPADKG